MKLYPLQAGVLVVLAAVAVGISFVSPAALPQYTQVAPPQDTRIVCQPVGEGKLFLTANSELQLAQYGQNPAAQPAPAITEAAKLVTARGIGPNGGIFAADGSWSPCQQAGTAGQIIFPSAEVADLRITNSDTRDASVDLKLIGSKGEIQALGARGINLAPGQSRSVAVSVLAQGVEGPIGVLWQTTRGRVSVLGTTLGAVRYVSPPAPLLNQHFLSGLSKGEKPVLYLLNPGEDRVSARVQFHSSTSTFTPAGGEDVSVPGQSVLELDLAEGTGGDLGAFTVSADREVAVALMIGSGATKGISVSSAADNELSAVAPGGSIVQVTNLADQQAAAKVAIGETISELSLEAGTSAEVQVPEGEPVVVKASSDTPIFSSAIAANSTGVIPLNSTRVIEPDPLEAELSRPLR